MRRPETPRAVASGRGVPARARHWWSYSSPHQSVHAESYRQGLGASRVDRFATVAHAASSPLRPSVWCVAPPASWTGRGVRAAGDVPSVSPNPWSAPPRLPLAASTPAAGVAPRPPTRSTIEPGRDLCSPLAVHRTEARLPAPARMCGADQPRRLVPTSPCCHVARPTSFSSNPAFPTRTASAPASRSGRPHQALEPLPGDVADRSSAFPRFRANSCTSPHALHAPPSAAPINTLVQ